MIADPGSRTKACTGCLIVKLLEEFSFDKRHADGRQSRCRACFRAKGKQYREADPERVRELKQLDYERNGAKYRARSAAYRAENRERLNREARERHAALSPEALEIHWQRERERQAAYRLRNAEACAARITAWKNANPDKVLDTLHRRRARQHGKGDSEKFTRSEIGERDGWVCGICHAPIDKNLRWPDQRSASLDHVVPLAHGGAHARVNARITHWICNVRRGADRRVIQLPPVADVGRRLIPGTPSGTLALQESQ